MGKGLKVDVSVGFCEEGFGMLGKIRFDLRRRCNNWLVRLHTSALSHTADVS